MVSTDLNRERNDLGVFRWIIKRVGRPGSIITLVLLSALFLIVWATARWRGSFGWLEAYGPNLATELAGILITVLLVERIVAFERAQERMRVAKIGAARIRRPLAGLVGLFENMVKASLPSEPDRPVGSYDRLFSPEFTEHLRFLDFRGGAPEVSPHC